ncbi:cathepsin L-like cysteine proteinase [Striga asiatica]|uniref:Cathepsin L-like cysteine proteinase n=1 Tax=Striga asiatica TaxID=4170 RepID=A0A5A7P2A4_STRAF|nr:cathepsin L-like cysteine proteinase [Striga asiatica]
MASPFIRPPRLKEILQTLVSLKLHQKLSSYSAGRLRLHCVVMATGGAPPASDSSLRPGEGKKKKKKKRKIWNTYRSPSPSLVSCRNIVAVAGGTEGTWVNGMTIVARLTPFPLLMTTTLVMLMVQVARWSFSPTTVHSRSPAANLAEFKDLNDVTQSSPTITNTAAVLDSVQNLRWSPLSIDRSQNPFDLRSFAVNHCIFLVLRESRVVQSARVGQSRRAPVCPEVSNLVKELVFELKVIRPEIRFNLRRRSGSTSAKSQQASQEVVVTPGDLRASDSSISVSESLLSSRVVPHQKEAAKASSFLINPAGNLCELYAHISFMEVKLRERDDHRPLSIQHVMDAVPECKNKKTMRTVIGPQLNGKIMEVLMDEGVAFEEDYQTKGRWNPRNQEKFLLRRRRENLSVVKKLFGYNIDRQPSASGEAFNFAESLRHELQRTLLVARRGGGRGRGRGCGGGRGYGTHEGMEYFEIMSSWGGGWSDNGFGRIVADDILEAYDYEVAVETEFEVDVALEDGVEVALDSEVQVEVE